MRVLLCLKQTENLTTWRVKRKVRVINRASGCTFSYDFICELNPRISLCRLIDRIRADQLERQISNQTCESSMESGDLKQVCSMQWLDSDMLCFHKFLLTPGCNKHIISESSSYLLFLTNLKPDVVVGYFIRFWKKYTGKRGIRINDQVYLSVKFFSNAIILWIFRNQCIYLYEFNHQRNFYQPLLGPICVAFWMDFLLNVNNRSLEVLHWIVIIQVFGISLVCNLS